MKAWRLVGLMTMLCFIMPAFVSCDKDDDEPADTDGLAGVYSGSLSYSVSGYEPGDIKGTYDLKILKDANDEGDVTVVIPECTFTPPITQGRAFTIPELSIEGVDVAQKGDVYTLNKDKFRMDINGVTYSGNLSGRVNGKNVVLEYLVRPGRMPMDINFTFSGTLK